jgi:hypothetical protein
MRHPGPFVAGCLAGALAAYYFDPVVGARRRALARDKLVSAGHGLINLTDLATLTARRAANRVQGVLATGHLDARSRRPPQDDQQLHDRIRARLGRIVRHSRQLHVDVSRGHVRLSGRALREEASRLLAELYETPGVRDVRTHLRLFDRDDEMLAEISRHTRTEEAATVPQQQGTPA